MAINPTHPNPNIPSSLKTLSLLNYVIDKLYDPKRCIALLCVLRSCVEKKVGSIYHRLPLLLIFKISQQIIDLEDCLHTHLNVDLRACKDHFEERNDEKRHNKNQHNCEIVKC